MRIMKRKYNLMSGLGNYLNQIKRAIFLLGSCIVSLNAVAQFSELEKEFMEFEQNHNDSLPQALYIDSAFCAAYNLKNITKNFRRMNVWNLPGREVKDIKRVCDIRWVFNDKMEALAFHKKYLSVNAEFGEEIKRSGIDIENVTQLRIFRENEKTREMNKALGVPMNFYYFLFVVDNCVAKVFVCTKTEVNAEKASVFAVEAARRLNLAKGR